MDILNSIFSFFAKFFEVLGAVSGVNPCSGWFDEPEVPEELTKLYGTKEQTKKYSNLAEKCKKSIEVKLYNKKRKFILR